MGSADHASDSLAADVQGATAAHHRLLRTLSAPELLPWQREHRRT
jgi:hypothetical protein